MRNSLSQSLRQYPLSHGLRRASSPKGTPFGNAGNFAITAQSRPLGEGGKAVGFDGGGCCSHLNPLSPLPLVASRFPYLSLRDIFPRPGEVFPLRGSFFALPESLWFCRILCRNRKSSPFRGSWHRAAMTERVFPSSHFFYQSVTFRFVLFVVYYGQHGSPWQH